MSNHNHCKPYLEQQPLQLLFYQHLAVKCTSQSLLVHRKSTCDSLEVSLGFKEKQRWTSLAHK